jgi:hypothetical protein
MGRCPGLGLGNIWWMKADFVEAMRRGGHPP